MILSPRMHPKTRRRPAPQEPAPRPHTDRRLALLLALLAFLVYNANFRLLAEGDSYPARFLPFALWNHGTLYLDPVREGDGPAQSAYLLDSAHRQRSLASVYPIVAPFLAAPVYLPAVLWMRAAGETYERLAAWLPLYLRWYVWALRRRWFGGRRAKSTSEPRRGGSIEAWGRKPQV